VKRTKQWWSALSKAERSYLVYAERFQNSYSGMGGYLPDDCSECRVCGDPMLGSGTCTYCINKISKLITKANSAPRGGASKQTEKE